MPQLRSGSATPHYRVTCYKQQYAFVGPLMTAGERFTCYFIPSNWCKNSNCFQQHNANGWRSRSNPPPPSDALFILHSPLLCRCTHHYARPTAFPSVFGGTDVCAGTPHLSFSSRTINTGFGATLNPLQHYKHSRNCRKCGSLSACSRSLDCESYHLHCSCFE